jgi:hypothetical protein
MPHALGSAVCGTLCQLGYCCGISAAALHAYCGAADLTVADECLQLHLRGNRQTLSAQATLVLELAGCTAKGSGFLLLLCTHVLLLCVRVLCQLRDEYRGTQPHVQRCS